MDYLMLVARFAASRANCACRPTLSGTPHANWSAGAGLGRLTRLYALLYRVFERRKPIGPCVVMPTKANTCRVACWCRAHSRSL